MLMAFELSMPGVNSWNGRWSGEKRQFVRVQSMTKKSLVKPGRYSYDFGDGWELSVVLKGIVELPIKFKRHLVDGARAFPPEDCGGTFGYEECLVALGWVKNTEYGEEEVADRKEWLGGWHPDDFNLQKARDDFDE